MEQNQANRLNISFEGIVIKLSLSYDALRGRYNGLKECDETLQNFAKSSIPTQKEFDLLVGAYCKPSPRTANGTRLAAMDLMKKSAAMLPETAPKAEAKQGEESEVTGEEAAKYAEVSAKYETVKTELGEVTSELSEVNAKYETLLAKYSEEAAKYDAKYAEVTREVSEVSAKYDEELHKVKDAHGEEIAAVKREAKAAKEEALTLLGRATGNTEGVLIGQISDLKGENAELKARLAEELAALVSVKDGEINDLNYKLSGERRGRAEDRTRFEAEYADVLNELNALKEGKRWHRVAAKILIAAGSFSAANAVSMVLGFLGILDKFGIEGLPIAIILVIVFTAVLRYLKNELSQSSSWGLLGIGVIEFILGYIHAGYFFNILCARITVLGDEAVKKATESASNNALFFAVIVSVASFYSALMTWNKTADIQEAERVAAIEKQLKADLQTT